MIRNTLMFALAAVLATGLLQTATAVEELAAPLNAIPDIPLESESHAAAMPVSPYDAVPFEHDPAVDHAVAPYEVAPYQPAPFEPYSEFAMSPSVHVHAAPMCCTPPKIRYWNHPLLATDVCPCNCQQTIETHVQVPCQCCPVAVKVCVPVCCVGPPRCDVTRDLLGRKTYEFCWSCGYRIKIVDRHTGTLVVHTFNP